MSPTRSAEQRQARHSGGIPPDLPPAETLPRESVRPASWRGLGALAATLLLGFAALNALAGAYLARYTPNLGYWLLAQKWALVETAEPPVAWLVLGDSSCNQGIDPEVWNAAFGDRPLNLCTLGDMLALDDVWMLRRLIERGIVPEHVLVVHAYDTWSRQTRPVLLGRIPERTVWRNGDPGVSLSWRETGLELLSRHVPLVSQNTALFGALVNPGTWFEAQFSLTDNGFMVMRDADPEGVEADAEQHLMRLRNEPYMMSAANAAALEALASLAETHGFEIHLTSSPVYEELAEREAFRRRIERIDTRLADWAARSPRLHYLPEIVTFPATRMESADHVTHSGARIYTRRIADLVREYDN